MHFEKLFTPIRARDMELRNRIVFPAIGTNFATKEGKVTDKMIEHYEVRARGGAGLLIVEASAIDMWGKHRDTILCVYDDVFLPGLKALVERVHSHGAAIALQLVFPGRTQKEKYARNGQPWAPSPIAIPNLPLPKEMSVDDIFYITRMFSEAAKRAKDAGFDSIEFHGAHGLLHHQFFSPLSNIRKDKYGGSLENRMRFALETVEATRKAVGTGYPLMYRVSAFENLPGGYEFEDVITFSKRLEDAGIDIVSLSAGGGGTPERDRVGIQTAELPRGFLAKYSEIIKGQVKIPVVVAGRINGPEIAEQILEQGKADLIGIGRSLLVDPELPNKARRGDIKSIRGCIACAYCLFELRRSKPLACILNPFIGREKDAEYRIAERRKKILVIGGGPAGMEAAIVAKQRGHDVELYEKEGLLGGQLRWSIKLPKKEFKLLLDHQTQTIAALGVPVHLGVEVDAEFIKEAKPDAVVLATGSSPKIPNIPGVRQENSLNFLEALDHPDRVGKTVVLIGGGLVAAQTAEFLATQGKKVTIMPFRRSNIASDLNLFARAILLNSLKELDVKIRQGDVIKEIEKDAVILEGKEGKVEKLSYDTLVLAAGAVSCGKSLISELEGMVPEIYAIGDCVSPRKLYNAIHEATEVSLKV
jgi:2,4-dienoyl-CoA reductase-like NADH-dependent reductase (Old Yellow Enzyme family)/thioredoxin reductase